MDQASEPSANHEAVLREGMRSALLEFHLIEGDRKVMPHDQSAGHGRGVLLDLITSRRRETLAQFALAHIAAQVPDLGDEVAEIGRVLRNPRQDSEHEAVVDRLVCYAEDEIALTDLRAAGTPPGAGGDWT